jgi:shikimate kinase
MHDLHNTVAAKLASLNPSPSIVLVGMMMVGKSAVGRKIAARLNLPFVDSDTEIESAASMSIRQIFETHGEEEFRKGEKRVIVRLLQEHACVLSTGGGAFMDADTRALVHQKAISVWLKADIETLVKRSAHKENRPLLLKGEVRERLQSLLTVRDPIYAEADVTVVSDDRPIDDTVERVLNALGEFLQKSKMS